MKRIFLHFIEDIIRNISGPLGIRIRRSYYRRRLGSSGKKLIIDTGVFFQGPREIFLGDNVWIDKNCVLIAGKIEFDSLTMQKISGENKISEEGTIRLGSNSHLGIGTILQGHGGIRTGDYFTCSAGCRIYSYSNDYRKSFGGTMENPSFKQAFILGFVEMGRNVWLGLGVSLISTSIGDDVFVLPHSVVFRPLDTNTVAAGNPAVTIRHRFIK